MKLVWTEPAKADLKAAIDYIAEDNYPAAVSLNRRVRAAADRLIDYPRMGRSGRIASSRELVVSGTPYVVVYRIETTAVEILRIIHGAQRWPPE